MEFEWSAAPTGAGKTRAVEIEMISNRGLWLLAVERVAAMYERKREIEALAREMGVDVLVVPIHSKHPDGDWRFEVPSARQAVELAGSDVKFRQHGHVVVIVSHETLKRADLHAYEGWSVVIDEAINPIATDSHSTPSSVSWWKANYSLQPADKRKRPKTRKIIDTSVGQLGDEDTVEATETWMRVMPTENCASMEDVLADDKAKSWATFHRHVVGGEQVYTSMTRPEDMIVGRWSWYAIWNPVEELAAFDRVIIIANNFRQTMCFLVLDKLYGHQIRWVPFKVTDTRTWKRRKMTVRYYVETHKGTTYFWTTNPDGQQCIETVAADLASRLQDGKAIWSANEAIRHVFAAKGVQGDYLTPRQHGSNVFQDRTQAAMIFSAKPSPFEKEFYGRWEITEDQVESAREHEALIQFVSRFAVRDPNSAEDLEVYVYNKWQAQVVADYFAAGHCDVEIELVETTISHVRKPKQGERRSTKLLTMAEELAKTERKKQQAAERQRRKRERDAAAKAA